MSPVQDERKQGEAEVCKRESVKALKGTLCSRVPALLRFSASTHLRVYASTLLLFLAGCGVGTARKHALDLQVSKLQQEKADLTAELEQCRIDNAQVRQQVQALTALPKDGRENPYKLVSVRMARFTGFYDKDETGKRDKLLVYLQPIDENGDVVKAAGTVDVELWNLNDSGDQARLGQWQVSPAKLRTCWFAALVSSYRLTFDAPMTPELLAQPLTVRVTFIDYLTGETFHDQHVIQPRSG